MKVVSWIILLAICYFGMTSCSCSNNTVVKNQPKWFMDYTDGTDGKQYHLEIVFLEMTDKVIRMNYFNDDVLTGTIIIENIPNREPGFKWSGRWKDTAGIKGYVRLNEKFDQGSWSFVGSCSDGAISDEFKHPTIIYQQ